MWDFIWKAYLVCSVIVFIWSCAEAFLAENDGRYKLSIRISSVIICTVLGSLILIVEFFSEESHSKRNLEVRNLIQPRHAKHVGV